MQLSKPLIINYYPEIDFIKAFAIISVIILHILTYSEPKTILYNSFAAFHIWQAVPLFMLILGFTFRLSIEKQHSIGKIITSRFTRLAIPLFITYCISFLLIFIFNLDPVIDWHIFIGLLPIPAIGNYFITLYIETILYFVIFYYLVKNFNKYFVILFFILISILGELIAYSINLSDFYIYSSSLHRYILLVSLGYYFYDIINDNKDYFILILGGISTLLLYFYNINHYPIWPYREYTSAKLWEFHHFPYEFYTVLFAFILFHLYRQINYKFIEKIVITIGNSSLHIFLTQIFVFFIERWYKINMDYVYAILTLFISLIIGIIWHTLENLILKLIYKNVN